MTERLGRREMVEEVGQLIQKNTFAGDEQRFLAAVAALCRAFAAIPEPEKPGLVARIEDSFAGDYGLNDFFDTPEPVAREDRLAAATTSYESLYQGMVTLVPFEHYSLRGVKTPYNYKKEPDNFRGMKYFYWHNFIKPTLGIAQPRRLHTSRPA